MSATINLGSGLEHVHVTERLLLDRLFANFKRRRGQPFWLSVHAATGHGSNVSMALCREFGYCPETGKRIEVPT
jgi:uncharacterized membrane-anchored protein